MPHLDEELAQLNEAISRLEAQRPILGDEVIETALAALYRQVTALRRQMIATSTWPVEGERRQVTVLFADISGFTAMSEGTDPEQVRTLMNACFDHLVPCIEKYDGTVDKFVGDAIVALFGAPVAHEDDPERALWAALEMMAALEVFNARHQTDLGLHIGINTGLVIAGGLGSQGRQQYSVVGDAVNLASRLEDLSQRGEILLGASTYRLTASRFEFEKWPLVRVKGKREPVVIYRLLGYKKSPAALRGVEGLRVPLIGRNVELHQLQQALRLVQKGQGSGIAIVGEEGLGKSRLVAEARQTWKLQPEAGDLLWAEGRALSYAQKNSYAVLRNLLHDLLDIPVGVPAAQVAVRLGATMERLLPQTDQDYPHLAYALGLFFEDASWQDLDMADIESLRERIAKAFCALIEAQAQERPLVLVWEDLHWADAASFHLLQSLFPLLREVPLLLILSFRPEGEQIESLQRTLAADPTWQTLRLTPLSQEESRQLLDILFPTGKLPFAMVEAILDRAEGNPLFLGELLRSLLDAGLAGMPADRQAVQEIEIPETLQGVIMARADRLSPPDRRVLQTASVIGRIFQQEVLVAMLGPTVSSVEESLQELRRREFIRLRQEEAPGGPVYIFKHAITQAVIYNGLLIAQRQELHRRAGEAIEALFYDQRDELAATLAHHYAEAGEGGRAVAYLLQAGDQARRLYACEEAVSCYRQALPFLQEEGAYEQAGRTLLKLGLTYHLAFDFHQSHQAYNEGFALWQKAGETLAAAALPPAPYPLRIASEDPITMDPSLAADLRSMALTTQLFSGLVHLSPETNITPAVASHWEILDNGHTYLFFLRDDVRWSDGHPLTAHDFVYTWKRALQETRGAPLGSPLYDVASRLYDIRAARAFHQGELDDPDQIGLLARDDHALVIHLERPTGYFLHLLALCGPVPRHVVERHGHDWTDPDTIVTNGPFLLTTWVPGQRIRLTRNPASRERFSGNVQQVELCLLSDPQALLRLYENGRLDVLDLEALLVEDRTWTRQRHAGEYVPAPSLSVMYAGFDVQRPPLDDRRIRRALVQAVDREAVAGIALQGFAAPALGGFIPPGMPGHSPDISLPYDPEAARRLLAEAGYPDGRGLPMIELLTTHGRRPLGQYLQQVWREILGLEVAWRTLEWTAFLDRLDHRPPHIFLYGWVADYPDPDSFLRVSPAWRRTHWEHPRYINLVEKARHTPSQQERLRMYREADRLLIEAAVVLPLTYGQSHLLIKPWVRRFPTSPLLLWYWKDAILDPYFPTTDGSGDCL